MNLGSPFTPPVKRCLDRGAQQGFTLTELAVVVVIVAIMIGGMLLPLSAQDNIRRTQETQNTLNNLHDALLGFAAANGRLPCPATDTSQGIEAPKGGGICTNATKGFAPGVTLGVSPQNSQGQVIDAWGQPVRYTVTAVSTSAFTTAGKLSLSLVPDLRVCIDSASIPLTKDKCAIPETTNVLVNSAVAVLFSQGANGANIANDADEAINQNSKPIFVSHPPTYSDPANAKFDDLVVWLSPNILFNRMIAAGRLP